VAVTEPFFKKRFFNHFIFRFVYRCRQVVIMVRWVVEFLDGVSKIIDIFVSKFPLSMYVDFYAKMSLILDTAARNSKTQWTIVHIQTQTSAYV